MKLFCSGTMSATKTTTKSVTILFILCVFLFFTVDMASEPDTPPSEGRRKLAESINHFAWDLYQSLLMKNPNDNLFFSPASIAMALGMTYLGARNETAQQMMNVLHLDRVHSEHVHPTFGEMIDLIRADSAGFTLHTANRLCTNNKYSLLDSYVDATKTHYKAVAESHDFAGDAEGSRQKINSWVERETNDKIQNLLPEGSVDALTALILVNAMYFKGDWKSKFNPETTVKADFSVSSSSKTTVPLMSQKTHFDVGYNGDLRAHAIRMPYVDDRLNLFVILPEYHQKTAGPLEVLQELEKKLNPGKLQNIKDLFRMRDVEVTLSLPRFKLESSANLKHHLPEMGMRDLFDIGKADLSGMGPNNNIFVSDVFHKAFIDVNEEGSEAAAATAARIQVRFISRVFEFKADHPFLFFLHDNRTDLILFIGRMIKPDSIEAPQRSEL